MTTHVPYGPDTAAPQQYPQHPPTAGYPTAPPWATPPVAVAEEATAPAYGTVTPWGAPYAEHGQLLVPFPEEMHNAARPRPPSWWPIVVWTFFFGILGAVSAKRRADQARRGRNSVAPYWVAWGVTVAVSAALGMLLAVMGGPAYLAYREGAITKLVQEKVVTDHQLQKTAGVTATAAVCEPTAPRVNALRTYDCLLTMDDGRTGSLTVTADDEGHWTAVPRK